MNEATPGTVDVSVAPAGQPVMLFGLGAHKAGTTWLHDYLSGHPECHFRSIKELHFFDRKTDAQKDWWRENWTKRRKRFARELKSASPDRQEQIRALDADFEDWLRVEPGDIEAYRAYLLAGLGERRLTGDITPSYAMLGPSEIQAMMSVSDQSRFVFIMRDPLDRLWSNMRMFASRSAGQAAGPEDLTKAAHAKLLRVIQNKERDIALRCDYARIVQILTEAVPFERFYVGFYEELFEPEKIRALTDFLGLSPHPAGTSKIIHEGVKLPLDPQYEEAAIDWLSGQYAFVHRAFGDKVPARWRKPPELG